MPINNKERLQRARERLFLLNREVNKLERLLFGKERGVGSRFGYDPRYRWTRDEDGLSPLMRRFVSEYPKDLNAGRAAVRAGYSEKGAAVRGNWLLKKRKVVKALRKEFKAMLKRNRISQDRVIGEVAKIAYSNITDFVNWTDDGITLTPSKVLSKADTAVIKSVKETVGPKSSTIHFQLYDKPNALLTLCRFLGILDRGVPKEDELELAKKVKAQLKQINESVPSEPLPDNVRRFDTKLKKYEDRVNGEEGYA